MLSHFGWYSFHDPAEGRRLCCCGWLVVYQGCVSLVQVTI